MNKIIVFLLIFIAIINAESEKSKSEYTPVKNIIIYIGDGMGSAQVASASYKYFGVNGKLEIEKLPIVGLIKTHAADNLITDSAAGATAFATGYKTNVGMVSVTPDSIAKETIFEFAVKKGIKTGVVATSHITDATPSCFISHVPKRSMQSEIAEQMIFSGASIIMGGGKSQFIPKTDMESERVDDKDLISNAIENGFEFIDTKEKLEKCNSDKILGLFNLHGFTFNNEEPTLAEMTTKAISILSKSENGFMLMVEGSQIDWKAHDNDFEKTIEQVKLFDDAVKVGRDFAEINGETLIIVTADHETGGLTLTGNNKKNNLDLGVNWATGGHTAIPVPIYSYGPNSQFFTGVMDNTDIPKIISELFSLNMNFNFDSKNKIVELEKSEKLND